MSADMIGYCPKCIKKLVGEEGMEEGYLVIQDRIAEGEINISNTLREYIDVGMLEDGTFFMDYSCECHECGWKYQHKEERKVDLS